MAKLLEPRDDVRGRIISIEMWTCESIERDGRLDLDLGMAWNGVDEMAVAAIDPILNV